MSMLQLIFAQQQQQNVFDIMAKNLQDTLSICQTPIRQ